MASAPELVQIDLAPKIRGPKPEWLKARAPMGDGYHELKRLARTLELHTVCESAQCPNIGECWNHGTATFMLLGNLCTRRCGFCAVPKGAPLPIDREEPGRVAEAVRKLGETNTDRLVFQYVGPLPPYNFVTIKVRWEE